MVSHLEDKADVADVASFLEAEQWVRAVFAEDMSLTLMDEVNACAHYAKTDQA